MKVTARQQGRAASRPPLSSNEKKARRTVTSASLSTLTNLPRKRAGRPRYTARRSNAFDPDPRGGPAPLLARPLEFRTRPARSTRPGPTFLRARPSARPASADVGDEDFGWCRLVENLLAAHARLPLSKAHGLRSCALPLVPSSADRCPCNAGRRRLRCRDSPFGRPVAHSVQAQVGLLVSSADGRGRERRRRDRRGPSSVRAMRLRRRRGRCRGGRAL